MSADLEFIILFTLITQAFFYVPVLNQTALKFTFGLAMLFFLPGYAFVAALYPGSAGPNGVERLALSFGMSICLFPLLGLVLSYTPRGLRFEPLVGCLTALTLALALAASTRRLRLAGEERFCVDFRKAAGEIKAAVFAGRSGYDAALTAILALSVVASVAAIGYAIAMPRQGERFTELYVLGPNGTAGDYPRSFYYGDTREVVVGVVNHEYRNVTYDLVVSLNDSVRSAPLYRETLPIADGQSWEKRIALAPRQNGTGMDVEFRLYADWDRTKPYRECHFKIDVTSPV